MENTALQHPLALNLNGSGIDSLLAQNHAAFIAVGRALQEMREAAPHGRDYSDSREYRRAREQHDERVEALSLVMAQYEAICQRLVDHGGSLK